MTRRLAATLLLLAAALVAVFVLASQNVRETGETALWAERQLARLMPPTGTGASGEPTWFGLTIRRLAHVVEFALVGAAACLVALVWWGHAPRAAALAVGICLVASVGDELHKIFVPGRHFDPHDLLLDAVGYLAAVAVVYLLGAFAGSAG